MQEHRFFSGPICWRRPAIFLSLLAGLAFRPCDDARAQTAIGAIQREVIALPDAPLPLPADSVPEPQPQLPSPEPEQFFVAQAQSTQAESSPVTLGAMPRDFLRDQGMIWSSPASIRTRDLEWLLPLSAAEGVAFKTSRYTMTNVVSHDSSFNKAAINTSNVLVDGWMAAPIAIWGYGHAAQDYHATETGILAAESILDGLVVQQILKWTFRRERPSVDDARGRFFRHGVGSNSSFPSSHSLLSWCASSAIAAETHSHWAHAGLYAGSGSVALMRVFGQKHFPSDVLAGSSLGWLIGHNVVVRRRFQAPAATSAP
jgi:membrane-associated phospholipid phosphatase